MFRSRCRLQIAAGLSAVVRFRNARAKSGACTVNEKVVTSSHGLATAPVSRKEQPGETLEHSHNRLSFADEYKFSEFSLIDIYTLYTAS